MFAVFYGGYGYGGSSIFFLVAALVVIRIIASRRSGPSRPYRGPGPQGYGWGSGPAPGPPPGSNTPMSSTSQPSTSPSPTPADAPSSPTADPAPGPAGSFKIPPGWFPDPTGRFDQRYWSGTTWTEHVTKDGVPNTDAPPASLSGTT